MNPFPAAFDWYSSVESTSIRQMLCVAVVAVTIVTGGCGGGGDSFAGININRESGKIGSSNPGFVTDNPDDGNAVSNATPLADLNPPIVTVTSPGQGSMIDNDSVLVRGRASDLSAVDGVAVNGVMATSFDGYANWEVRVPLTEGKNDLVVSAIDAIGNITLAAAGVRVDSVKSVIQRPSDIVIDLSSDRAYVIDPIVDALVAVNLVTNLRSVISANSMPNSGVPMLNVEGLVLDRWNNRVIAVDQTARSVFAIDLENGLRSVISVSGDGQPVNMQRPMDLALDSDTNTLYVADPGAVAILTVDIATGERAVFSDNSDPLNKLAAPVRVELDTESGRLFVLDTQLDAIFSIEQASGVRMRFSDAQTPDSEHPFDSPTGMIYDAANNRLMVTDSGLGQVIAVNGVIGRRSIYSQNCSSCAGDLQFPQSIAFDVNRKRYVVVDRSTGALVGIGEIEGQENVNSIFHTFHFQRPLPGCCSG